MIGTRAQIVSELAWTLGRVPTKATSQSVMRWDPPESPAIRWSLWAGYVRFYFKPWSQDDGLARFMPAIEVHFREFTGSSAEAEAFAASVRDLIAVLVAGQKLLTQYAVEEALDKPVRA